MRALGLVKAKKSELEADISKLTTKVDQASAKSVSTKAEVKESGVERAKGVACSSRTWEPYFELKLMTASSATSLTESTSLACWFVNLQKHRT